MSLRRLACVALAVVALAGCGGRATSALTPPVLGTASAERKLLLAVPFTGTLYVASRTTVFAYDVNASDPATALRSFVPHEKQVNLEQIMGLATAPDGTLAVLQNYYLSNFIDQNCRTVMEPPIAAPVVAPQRTYPCDANGLTQGRAVARGANGFDILYGSGNTAFVEHLAPDGSISSTLTLPSDMFSNYDTIAPTPGGGDYVGKTYGANVLRYGVGATTGTPYRERIVVPGAYVVALATAPDHTLYAAAGSFLSESIYAYPAGATTPARTLGPFQNESISALAVGAQNELYVALNSSSRYGGNDVRVYPADANGKIAPLRRITNPVPQLEVIRALAISQP